MTHPTDPPDAGQATGPRFIRLLRLVHPMPELPAAPPGKRRRGPPVFTAEEERTFRASLKTARAAAGTWAVLAGMMGVFKDTLADVANGRDRVTAEIAVRLARALKVSLESLITPGVRVVKNPCPTCGRGDP